MIRVGIADSGIDGAARAHVVAVADFLPGRPTGTAATDAHDRHGHGSAVAAIIAATAGVALLSARIYGDTLRTDATAAAAAIDWLTAQGARLINLSFGTTEDRQALREACARAVARRILVVAAAPARGRRVFPAGYPGVVRATGDARCAPGEISWLAAPHADFGGCVRWGFGKAAGASAGCAQVTAALAACLARSPDADNDAVLADLRAGAAYRGLECRARG